MVDAGFNDDDRLRGEATVRGMGLRPPATSPPTTGNPASPDPLSHPSASAPRGSLARSVRRFGRWLLGPLERYIRRIIRDELLTRPQVFGDPKRLRIAATAVVNDALFNLVSGTISVEPYAFFGHNVRLLTGSHDYRKLGKERLRAIAQEGHDIVVRTGAWIASNATILGPCVVGEHAVVAAGSVVDADVPPYAIVGGVPARVLGRVEPHA